MLASQDQRGEKDEETMLREAYLEEMKPVLRKSFQHESNNVVLVFKSMEIVITSGLRSFSPIYVPINLVRQMYQIPQTQEHELVKLLFENVKTTADGKNFEIQREKLAADLEVLVKRLKTEAPLAANPRITRENSLERELPNSRGKVSFVQVNSKVDPAVRKPISTSYLQEGVELSIKINFPRVEYLSSNSILVYRTLTLAQLEQFFHHSTGFDPFWPSRALRLFTSNIYFK